MEQSESKAPPEAPSQQANAAPAPPQAHPEALKAQANSAARKSSNRRFLGDVRGFVERHRGAVAICAVVFLVAFGGVLRFAWLSGAEGDSGAEPSGPYTTAPISQGRTGSSGLGNGVAQTQVQNASGSESASDAGTQGGSNTSGTSQDAGGSSNSASGAAGSGNGSVQNANPNGVPADANSGSNANGSTGANGSANSGSTRAQGALEARAADRVAAATRLATGAALLRSLRSRRTVRRVAGCSRNTLRGC